MPESTPLTAAERDELRQLLADDLPFYDIQKIVPDVLRRLLAEHDSLAAQLAEALQELESRRELGRIDQRRIAEARGIARRYRAALVDAAAAVRGIGERHIWQQTLVEWDELDRAFDALHWPDPEEG